MLTSLFGELNSSSGGPRRPSATSDSAFAATAILESVATEVNARGQMVDRHSHELLVTGSPARAIRDHLAATRSDLGTATALMTLVDPAGVWAAAVIRALSDAGGRPIERLHLRDHATLRTLATIERTTLVRRHGDTLRIYHADVRAPGPENAEIPVALMERSQMTTVIVGPLQPHAFDALLGALQAATMLPAWRCPNLLFLLPPNAASLATKVRAVGWPARLHVELLSESMNGASAVWNAMLGVWNQVKAGPDWESNEPRDIGSQFGELTGGPAFDPSALHAPGRDVTRARAALAGMLALDGLVGCAIVDVATGAVQTRETVDPDADMAQAGAAAAHLMRAHRHVAMGSGLTAPVDEVLVSAGGRCQIIRPLARHPELLLAALFDRQRLNLPLARLQMAEVERGLDG